MAEAHLRTGIPAPKPPPAPVTVTITGKILYPAGPWGSNRPLRSRGAVLVYEGILYDPLKASKKDKRPTGNFEPTMTNERNVVHVYHKKLQSGEIFTESDGTFRITTKPISPYTYDLFLEVRDYNFVSTPGRSVEVFVYDLRGSIQLIFGPGSIPFSSQGVGTLRTPWPPPLFMTQMAVVNSVAFVDTQKLARRLSEIVSSPTYPTSIKLFRESALSQFNLTGEDFTHAEQLCNRLADGNLAQGFPERLAQNVTKVQGLGVKANSTAATLAAVLDRLVTLNIERLEQKTVLNPLLLAIGSALGDSTQYTDPTDDPVPDMAAACAILAVGGLMARDRATPTVTLSSTDLANRQKMLQVEIQVKK